jgi:hypothetical protein
MTDRPRVENAPGLTWRYNKHDGWIAFWRARADIVLKGFRPKNQRVWTGFEATETDKAHIADACRRLQDEMLMFGHGETMKVNAFTGTLKSLIECYQTDPDSSYHKKRWHVRKNHNFTLLRMVNKHGHEELASINARLLLVWHKEWSDDGKKLAMAHAMVGHLRTIFAFGATILESADCERLCGVLHKMRFKAPKPRTERLTAAQADAIREEARRVGWYSIALAQAFQFEFMMRQKDVIGEWVPSAEPGVSDILRGDEKWLHGLRWSEINDNLILKHTTSKREKDLVVDLKLAPMVLEELEYTKALYGKIPTTGAIIVNEGNDRPFNAPEFRKKWRRVADACGIPKSVKNMDTRAGAISEATDAGAELEHIRHAATHSDISMTQRYSRGSEEKIANVQVLRLKHRNKPGTE